VLRQDARNYLLSGGRSSAKSWSVAYWLLAEGARKPLRMLCVREVQHSIERSSAQLLRDLAAKHKCFDGWSWNQTEIRHKNGSSITFVGLSNVSRENLRSFEAVDLVWCEEAHALSSESLRVLLPTIRKEGSRLFFTYNPQIAPADPVEAIVKPMPNTARVHITFKDCEIFLSSVTRAMIEHDRAHNFALYEHVWEGLPLAFSESRVFKNFSIQDFSYEALRAQWESEEVKKPLPCLDGMFRSDFEKLLKERKRKKVVGLLFGADWGFSADPSAAVRCFYSPDGKRLFIEYEYYAIGTTIDKLPGELIAALPGIERSNQVRGDAARPELVRHVEQHGIPGMKSCRKWKASLEDGIQHLQSLEEIIVHPRCTHTVDCHRSHYSVHFSHSISDSTLL
jgi:phage terminase large subunit